MSHTPFQAPDVTVLAELLPAYDFEDLIAQGGMGAVYKARQRSLERDVAIKVLPKELGADATFREAFEVEAKAMAKLNHPNLVGVYDFGDIDGMPYIVMEFVDGNTLYESAYGTRVDPMQAVDITLGICAGLGHAHDTGLVHRDIKPANIFLNLKAIPKIGDFGLVTGAQAADGGPAMGTPGYAAPELFVEPVQIDQRADLFAVCVMLRELLTGQPPQMEAAAEIPCTGDKLLNKICNKGTAADPAARYQTASELVAALTQWKEQAAKIASNPLLSANKAAPAQRPVGVGGTPGRHVSLPSKKSSGSGGLVFALIFIGLLAAGGIFWKKSQAAKVAATEQEAEPVEDPDPHGVPDVQTTEPTWEEEVEHAAEIKKEDEAGKSKETPKEAQKAGRERAAEGEGGEEASAYIQEVNSKASKLVTEAKEKYETKLASNIEDLEGELKQWASKRSDRGEAMDDIDEIMELCEDDIMPDISEVEEDTGIQFSSTLSSTYDKAYRQQAYAQSDYKKTTTRLQSFYQKNLAKAAEEAVAAGDTKLAEEIREHINNAKDLDQWIELMAGGAEEVEEAEETDNSEGGLFDFGDF